MTGDERVRYCPACRLNVYNFSAMTASEIDLFIANHEGRLCGRLYRRKDGTLLTRDCPAGFRAVVKRVSRIAGTAFSAAMSLTYASAQIPENTSPLVQIERAEPEVDLVVTDPSGALVPKAHVLLVNEHDYSKLEGVTDSSGRWKTANLTAGPYTLTVEAPGFRTARQSLSVTGGKTVQVQLSLEVGATMGVIVQVESPSLELEPVPNFIVPREPGSPDTQPSTPNSKSKPKLNLKRLISPFRSPS